MGWYLDTIILGNDHVQRSVLFGFIFSILYLSYGCLKIEFLHASQAADFLIDDVSEYKTFLL